MFKVQPLPRSLSAAERDLRSERPAIRVEAARDLGLPASGEDRLRRVDLLTSALGDVEPSVRRQAIVSLADLSARESLQALRPMLADPEIGVREMAVMALGELAEDGDREILGRLASLLSAGAPPIRYQALIGTVRLARTEAEPELLRAFEDRDAEVRQLAVRLVDEYGFLETDPRPDLFAALERLAQDEDFAVRLLAQLELGEAGVEGPRDMIATVVRRRFRPPEPRDEQRAVELAGSLELHDLVEPLKRRARGFLGYSLDPFRWQARGSLARLGYPWALDRIERGLRSRSYLERNLAAQAAGASGAQRFDALLRGLAGEPNKLDDEVLAHALARLNAAPAPSEAENPAARR